MTIRGTYDEYLSSPYWRRVVRPRILRRAAGRCELCHGDYNTEVHHLTYERLGHERDEDLMALCAGCHATVHEHWREPTVRRGMVSLQSILARAAHTVTDD